MKDFKRILHIFRGQFMASLSNKRVWIGYIIGLVVALKSAYAYQGYADQRVFQIFEPYIMHLASNANVIMMLIGFILIIADAPFVDNRSSLVLYRSSRGKWFWAMALYIGVHSIIYYLGALFVTIIYSMRQGYVHNIWSRPMENLVLFEPPDALTRWSLASPGEALLLDYKPVNMLVYAIILHILYCLVLSAILYIFNMVFSRAVGTALVATVHVLSNILIIDFWNSKLEVFSLFYHSVFVNHINGRVNMSTSILLFLLILCLLLFAGPHLINRVDFKSLTGEKDE